MDNSSEGKGRWTTVLMILGAVIVGLVFVLLSSNRVSERMTCHSVDEDGSPALTCTTITHTKIIRGRNLAPYRVTQFVDVSALNPGSIVMASIELSAGTGDATVQYMFEPGRWASFSTRISSVPNAVAEMETEIVVTNNRVEFIIDGVRDVRLYVTFRNPVAPDEDDITMTQGPVLSIVEDGAQGILFTQEPVISIVGYEDAASITQQPVISIVGDGDGASGTQQPFIIIVGDGDGASGTQEAVAPTQP